MLKPFLAFLCNKTIVFKTFLCPGSRAVLNPQTRLYGNPRQTLQPLDRSLITRFSDISASVRLNENDTNLRASLVLSVVSLSPSALCGASSTEGRRRACVYVVPRLRIPLASPSNYRRKDLQSSRWLDARRVRSCVCVGRARVHKVIVAVKKQKKQQQYARKYYNSLKRAQNSPAV